MKIKKFNEKIKYKDYFRVKDLIKILQQVDGELPVGRNGHFGEFCPMDEGDFTISKSRLDPRGENISSYVGWRKLTNFSPQDIFEIISPDIGEEPD